MKRPPAFKLLLALGGLLAASPLVQAHLGPPYPIMNDQPIPGYVVSVTANPDVWRASAYVMLTAQSPAAQPVKSVDIWIQPVSRRVGRSTYQMTRESSTDPVEFSAQPDFDRAENFTVGIDIKLADGTVERFVTQTLATPPGIGPWGLLFFLVPFLLFGSLWGLVFFRRSRRRRARSRSAPKPTCSRTPSTIPPEARPRQQP